MSERNAFERQLADEIEYEVGPPRNVDATAITQQAKTTSPRWRFFTMSSTIKFAAAASALAVAGAAVLLIAPGGISPDDGVVAPGAEQPSASPAPAGDVDDALASSFFQGTTRILDYPDFGEKTEVEGGLVLEELRGQVYEGVVETTDVRVTGEMTGTLNQDTHLKPPDWGQPAITQWGTERIENDGGAWDCAWSGGEMQFMAQQRLLWCVGAGGYDGYAMRMMWTRNADGTVDVAGLAWQGELPEPIEVSAGNATD